MSEAVEHVDQKTDDQPDAEALPGVARKPEHHVDTGERAGDRDDRQPLHAERTHTIRIRPAEDQHADAHNREGGKRPDVRQVVDLVLVEDESPDGHRDASDDGRDVRRTVFRVDLRRPGREKAVAGHREEDPRLAVLEHEEHRGQRHHSTERDEPAGRREPSELERPRQRVGRSELLIRHEPRGHEPDDHVDERADGEAAEDADRHVPLRIPRFLGRGRDRVEADVREKHNRGALVNAPPAVRRERHKIRGVDVHRADANEDRQDDQLHHDHDVVRAHALFHADVQQPRDQHHDRERGEVEEDRHARHARGGLEQGVDRRVRAEQRGPISVRQVIRQVDTETCEQRIEVAAPRDRDRDVAHRVLEDQIPPDDPGHELAERRVRVRVGAAGLRDHGRELRVAEGGQPADGAEEDE